MNFHIVELIILDYVWKLVFTGLYFSAAYGDFKANFNTDEPKSSAQTQSRAKIMAASFKATFSYLSNENTYLS